MDAEMTRRSVFETLERQELRATFYMVYDIVRWSGCGMLQIYPVSN